MKRPLSFATACLICAGAAFAHSGVQNAAVKARMDAMSAIAAQMKVLGEMAKGVTVFDANAVRSAMTAMAEHAAETPALFEASEDDPKSEAKPEIWDNFEDFAAKSDQLEMLARELSTSIRTESDLLLAVQSLGAACQACHKTYRE